MGDAQKRQRDIDCVLLDDLGPASAWIRIPVPGDLLTAQVEDPTSAVAAEDAGGAVKSARKLATRRTWLGRAGREPDPPGVAGY